MATVYIPDSIIKIIFKNTEKSKEDYFRELAEKDMKEKGWVNDKSK